MNILVRLANVAKRDPRLSQDFSSLNYWHAPRWHVQQNSNTAIVANDHEETVAKHSSRQCKIRSHSHPNKKKKNQHDHKDIANKQRNIHLITAMNGI